MTLDETLLLRRFWQAVRQVWHQHTLWVLGLGGFLVVIVLAQLLLQILLNLWNRNFFNALERRDAAALWLQIQLFAPLALVSIVLAAASVWGRMTAQRGWREAMTHHVAGRWLGQKRFRSLGGLIRGTENPEYRIAVDIRIATDAPVDLSLAFLSSTLTAIAFFGVLWTVGGSIDLTLFGRPVTIPGYLVLGVIVYSGAISGLMFYVGRHLTGVIERSNQAEAEFREAADNIHDGNASAAADDDRRRTLWLKFRVVLLWWRELCWQLVRTTLVSHGNVLLAPVAAWILCAPKYLSGAMTLGELTQTAAAFVSVQGAFNWLVDNYHRLADWRSSAQRVASLLMALDELEEKEPAEPAAAGQ